MIIFSQNDRTFSLLDALVASAIIAWFAFSVFTSLGHPQNGEITSMAIVASAFVYGSLVVFLCGWMAVRRIWPWQVWGLDRFQPSILWMAFGCFLAALPLVFFSQELMVQILGSKPMPQPLIEFWTTHTGWRERILVAFMAVIVAPVCEEIIFRGYLYGIAKRYLGKWVAAVFISLVFAAIHLHLPIILGLFVLALVFTFVYERTGSLTAAILCHSFFNAFSLIGIILFPDLV